MRRVRQPIAAVLLALCLTTGALFSCGGQEDETGYVAGVTDNHIYHSDYLGLTCTLPQDWTYYSTAQLQVATLSVGDHSTLNYSDSAAVVEAVAESISIMDLNAVAADNSAMIYILIEDMAAVYGGEMDENSFLETVLPTYRAGVEAVEKVGDISVALSEISFAGENRACIMESYTRDGVPMYQVIIPIRRGERMAMVNLICAESNILTEMAAMFAQA